MSPDNRQHRGAHPADERLFVFDKIPVLRQAVFELSWLMSHGYSPVASLKLVGDRYNFAHRQRLAIARAACADATLEQRTASCRTVESIKGERLIIDGFNLIITVEAALSQGVLIVCRDRCIRDLASVHGSYRSVEETEKAICLIGEALESSKPESILWLLDRPISNSGRLARRIRDLASSRGWPWTVNTVFNPDTEILSADAIAVTSDSSVLDKVTAWINLNDYLVRKYLPQSWVIDLGEDTFLL
jgi:hypothetical protein